ncbi:hypothetical protein EAVNVH72_02961 [Elizabethkingia anophelis]|nr:hypothetical protein EAVNVH72_01351 [Elizabethkingia anophelis]CAI9685231.1 hypothetical protein EAVNVH72_02961 [Elizabethkingia anophelis]
MLYFKENLCYRWKRRISFDDDLILGLLGATRNYYELMQLNITVLFNKKYFE